MQIYAERCKKIGSTFLNKLDAFDVFLSANNKTTLTINSNIIQPVTQILSDRFTHTNVVKPEKLHASVISQQIRHYDVLGSSMSYKPRFETQPTRQIYIRPIYIDRATWAYQAQKNPLGTRELFPTHLSSSAERIYQYHQFSNKRSTKGINEQFHLEDFEFQTRQTSYFTQQFRHVNVISKKQTKITYPQAAK